MRGQYDAGVVLGAPVRAYRHEPDVAPDSGTETFVAWKLTIDNWRWAGMPFYLRTGKSMRRRSTEIAIRFHEAPVTLFRGADVERTHPNWLILRIQPEEGASLEFAAKRPGPTVKLANVSMDFDYKTYFKTAPNTGYETLIYDCMIGDATLFQRADNIEAGWRAVQPILDAWANNPPKDFPNYAAGGDGPAAAAELLARDGRAWRPLTPIRQLTAVAATRQDRSVSEPSRASGDGPSLKAALGFGIVCGRLKSHWSRGSRRGAPARRAMASSWAAPIAFWRVVQI